MNTLLLTLLRPVLAMLIQAFAKNITDWLKIKADALRERALGAAEAETKAARQVAEAVQRMDGVALPDDEAVLADLRAGRGLTG